MQDMPPPDYEEDTEIMLRTQKKGVPEERAKRPNMKMGEQLDPFSKKGDDLDTMRESLVVPLPVVNEPRRDGKPNLGLVRRKHRQK